MYIDRSVYPDVANPPNELRTLEEKADYVQRICAAWDFGILPDRQTFDQFAGWREIFERFPIPDSPAFNAFCQRFGWPHGSGRIFKAHYETMDAQEGRTDPYRDVV